MDIKKGLKDLLELCKGAEFRKVLILIGNNAEKVDSKSAIALIVGCCNCCVTNVSSLEKVSEDDLFVLLQFLKPYLIDVNESQILSYLQSIYFILKLLVKKKCYTTIAEMEDIVLPQFLPTSLEGKLKDTFLSSASLLHNLVTRAGSDKTVRYNKSLLKISYIILKIYTKVGNICALFSISYNCSVSLLNLEAPVEDLEDCFLYVLKLVEVDKGKVYSDEEFKPFLSNFVLILNGFFRKFNFDKAMDFYHKVFAVASRIFATDHIKVLQLIKLPLILTPKNFCLENVSEFKKGLRELNSLSAKQFIENKLNSLLYAVVFSYYKSVRSTDWCELPEESQTEIFQLIYSLGEFEAQSDYSCPCNCEISKNIYYGFTYSQYICALIEMKVNSGRKSTSGYHENATELLKKFCENIETLKENNCEKWKSAWNAIAMSIYNIGVHLYQKSNHACLFYFYTLIKHFIKFEVKSGMSVLKFSMISSAFTAICALSTKDYKKCMAFTALAIFLCPNQSDSLMTSWIKVKVSLRDAKTNEGEEAQKITLVTAFRRFETELAVLTNGVDLLKTEDKVNLLTNELEQYKKRWKSKVPMMMAFRELCDVADVETSVKVTVRIFGDCELNLHDDVPKILHGIIKQYEKKLPSKENSSESTIFLAVLYFLHYKYCVKDTITKNADEMEKSMFCTAQSNEPPDAIPRDPTEECDIVSSYESLRLDKYSCVMKYLNKSLTLFASVIKEDFNCNTSKDVSNAMLYDLLMKISFEYRLHCHRVRSLQALQIALKLAELDNAPCHIVESSGFIIENSEITKKYIKDVISVSDKRLGDITGSNVRYTIIYYICKAKAYLYHDYKEAYRIFQVASELYDAQEHKDQLELIKCQLLLLHYRFVLMPCSYKVVDHKKSTLLTIHSANATIFEAYNKSKIAGAYEMSILLEANEELARLYHNLRCPREVRAYCRETAILAQKLVLPFRCATYLVYLAHADLRSTRYDDCQVKLDGLADILCLTKRSVQVEEENDMPPCGGIEKEVESITNEMQEMVLDLPVPNHYKRQLSPSSPTFVIEPFYLPSFVKHGQSCDCFPCICFEYQALVLEKIRLDALINVKQDSPRVAKDFFLGAMELYHCYIRRYKGYREMVSKLVVLDLVPEFETEFFLAFGSTLLNYSYHLMREQNKSEALNVTNKLMELVIPRKVEFIHLYSEVLVQKLGYLTDVPEITVSREAELDLDVAQSSDMPRTPESKHTKVTLPKQSISKFSPPKRGPKKCLKFNLSPDDINANEEKPKKLSPISKRAPKTPAPKIQIFSNEDISIKSKTPMPSIQIFTDKKSARKKYPTSAVGLSTAFSSAEVATPTLPPKNDAVLKSRTKLLTQKLRQSTRKQDGACDEASGLEEVQSDRKRPSVRKNLLNELGGGDVKQSVGRGAIRKSTRQRKL